MEGKQEEKCEEEKEVCLPPLSPHPTRAPDGGWGWMVALGCFILCTIIHTLPYCFGILFSGFLLDNGASSTTTAWIYNLYLLIWFLSLTLTNPLCQEFGQRKIGLISVCVAATSVLLSGFSPNVTFLYFSFSILGGCGTGLSIGVNFTVLPPYFTKRAGQANTLLVIGAPLTQLVMAPFIRYLLHEYSLKGAALIQSAIVLNGVVAVALFHPVKWHMVRDESGRVMEQEEEEVEWMLDVTVEEEGDLEKERKGTMEEEEPGIEKERKGTMEKEISDMEKERKKRVEKEVDKERDMEKEERKRAMEEIESAIEKKEREGTVEEISDMEKERKMRVEKKLDKERDMEKEERKRTMEKELQVERDMETKERKRTTEKEKEEGVMETEVEEESLMERKEGEGAMEKRDDNVMGKEMGVKEVMMEEEVEKEDESLMGKEERKRTMEKEHDKVMGKNADMKKVIQMEEEEKEVNIMEREQEGIMEEEERKRMEKEEMEREIKMVKEGNMMEKEEKGEIAMGKEEEEERMMEKEEREIDTEEEMECLMGKENGMETNTRRKLKIRDGMSDEIESKTTKIKNENQRTRATKPNSIIKFYKTFTRVLKRTKSDIQVLRQYRALIISSTIMLTQTTFLNFMMLIPFVFKASDHSLKDAALCISLLGGTNLLVRLIVSPLSDLKWFNIHFCILLGYIMRGCGIAVAALTVELYWLLSSGAIFGFGLGLSLGLLNPCIVHFMGLQYFKPTIGIMGLMCAVGFLTLGPVIGVIRDTTNSYPVSLSILACMDFISCCLWMLMPQAQQRDMRRKESSKKRMTKV